MHTQGIFKRAANGLAWIERGVGILKHHLDDAGQRLSIPGLPARHDLPVQYNAAACRRQQAKDRKRHRRLAGAGLADEAEAFASLQLEIDTIDGAEQPPAAAQQAAAQRKMNRKILDTENEIVVRPAPRFMHGGNT
ncbi:hypothetical protein GCM10007857_16840 [Bradyrhizobium iriomotense]|uniref:Transposase DDE domain-containing protein n=1 Tax=Bradyrhizobium iriomotense TaxID=441950 RepID=A0ABQ6AS39_9BRAD|nr:hypothetical protein GCM10007857_16840 [Bradyrhizobium iriomotense]